MACYNCIQGHRASTCQHADRILVEVRPPGRPMNKCTHSPEYKCNCDKEGFTYLIPRGEDTCNGYRVAVPTAAPPDMMPWLEQRYGKSKRKSGPKPQLPSALKEEEPQQNQRLPAPLASRPCLGATPVLSPENTRKAAIPRNRCCSGKKPVAQASGALSTLPADAVRRQDEESLSSPSNSERPELASDTDARADTGLNSHPPSTKGSSPPLASFLSYQRQPGHEQDVLPNVETPILLHDPAANGTLVDGLEHGCNCGDGCTCLGCAAHPRNETTLTHVKHAVDFMLFDPCYGGSTQRDNFPSVDYKLALMSNGHLQHHLRTHHNLPNDGFAELSRHTSASTTDTPENAYQGSHHATTVGDSSLGPYQRPLKKQRLPQALADKASIGASAKRHDSGKWMSGFCGEGTAHWHTPDDRQSPFQSFSQVSHQSQPNETFAPYERFPKPYTFSPAAEGSNYVYPENFYVQPFYVPGPCANGLCQCGDGCSCEGCTTHNGHNGLHSDFPPPHTEGVNDIDNVQATYYNDYHATPDDLGAPSPSDITAAFSTNDVFHMGNTFDGSPNFDMHDAFNMDDAFNNGHYQGLPGTPTQPPFAALATAPKDGTYHEYRAETFPDAEFPDGDFHGANFPYTQQSLLNEIYHTNGLR